MAQVPGSCLAGIVAGTKKGLVQRQVFAFAVAALVWLSMFDHEVIECLLIDPVIGGVIHVVIIRIAPQLRAEIAGRKAKQFRPAAIRRLMAQEIRAAVWPDAIFPEPDVTALFHFSR